MLGESYDEGYDTGYDTGKDDGIEIGEQKERQYMAEAIVYKLNLSVEEIMSMEREYRKKD